MKVRHATVRDQATEIGTRAFSTEKGFELDYDAGILVVRRTEPDDDRVWLFPASNLVYMRVTKADLGPAAKAEKSPKAKPEADAEAKK